MPRKLLLALILASSTLTLPLKVEVFAASAPLSPEDLQLRNFLGKVYETMDSHYYLPVSKMLYSQFLEEFPAEKLIALNSKSKKTPNFVHLGAGLLVNRLKSPEDNFTNFVPPEKSKEFKEKAYAVTIDLGITGKKTKNGFEITHVQKHSEAFEKKVRAGDILKEVDGINVLSQEEKEIIKRLTPEQGKKTKLLILGFKTNIPYEIILESKSYFTETIKVEASPKPDVLVIRISHFNQMTGKDFGEELDLQNINSKKMLVIDLRDNGGGPPLAAREILGFFMPQNDFLFAIARKKQKPVMLASPNQSIRYEGPVTLLVNHKTGSAAEMFSGVLRSKKRAKLIGQKTAGATYLKSIYDFEDKSMIFMITSLTFLPDKSVFPKDGLTPDILLKENEDALQYTFQNL